MRAARTISRVRALTFDVGGTLITPQPSVGHLYAAVAAEQGAPNLSPLELNRRFQRAWKQTPGPIHSLADWSVLVDQTFDGLVDPPPSRSFFPILYQRFTQPDAWRVYPDVVPTLSRLQESQVPCAVISNWDDRLRPLLTRLGLAQWFQTLLISAEVGFAKPQRQIFQNAATTLGLNPDQILHIGDERAADYLGARQAGFQSILLDRNATSTSRGRIASLWELLKFIEAS